MEIDQSRRLSEAPVVFHGQAGEYFRIWIVNLALTIVTIGIYSAWAKVRKLRYLYTHTELAGSGFDFHANPKAILVGRVIALFLLALYFGAGYVHPFAPLGIFLLVLLAVPWLVVRSRIFRMRNTSYRGIRLDFRKNYKDAFKVYYGGALVTMITFGLGGGVALFWRNRFAVDNSGYGRTTFELGAKGEEFNAIYFKMLGLSFLAGILYFLFIMIVTPAVLAFYRNADPDSFSVTALNYALSLPPLAIYLAIAVYLQVRIRNLVWNTTTLGRNEFISTLSVRHMVFLYLTNVLAIVFSLGLLTPWAQVRTTRYRADQTTVLLADDWGNYVAAGNHEGTALGDEIGQVFDVDVGLGF